MTDSEKRGYRVVAVSLYEEEARAADRVTDTLKRAGWHKANRSLVVREALSRLQEDLIGKSSEDVFRYFIDRYARRAASRRKPFDSSSKAATDDEATERR